ncbi:hypothetical protein [Mesorhizobium sp. M4A.F.Ca.ET.050.02.1.1]|uniref:hypothetical protein n=1 Tax=Mesorhizobium sp. M4A.F.Ca.ET.050.02.1.1 TaxID=2496754 RepID=UPI00167D114F|nr:hypothetical protein [Mesorhizobium sp. M4A.F.Ca.ET.050.02.1.1]
MNAVSLGEQGWEPAKLPLSPRALRYLADAFFELLQAELRLAKFMAGFETSMASQRRGRHEVALQFGNARAHLSSVVLAQRSNQSTSKHSSSLHHPKSLAGLSTETLISSKPKRSKFNFGYFSWRRQRGFWEKVRRVAAKGLSTGRTREGSAGEQRDCDAASAAEWRLKCG